MKFFSWYYPHRQHIIKLCKLTISFESFHLKRKHTVQFSHSVMSDTLQPHEPQHARPPCHHQLPESTQTQVHRVGDAVHPSNLSCDQDAEGSGVLFFRWLATRPPGAIVTASRRVWLLRMSL